MIYIHMMRCTMCDRLIGLYTRSMSQVSWIELASAHQRVCAPGFETIGFGSEHQVYDECEVVE